MIRKLHHYLSGLKTKADSKIDLIIGLAESIINTRRKHFLHDIGQNRAAIGAGVAARTMPFLAASARCFAGALLAMETQVTPTKVLKHLAARSSESTFITR